MYGCAVPQPPFQNPHCGGQIINNQTVTLGCIPLTPPLMQDFQDFVNFLAGDTKRPRSFAIGTKGSLTIIIIYKMLLFDPCLFSGCWAMQLSRYATCVLQSTTAASGDISATTSSGMRLQMEIGLMPPRSLTAGTLSQMLTPISG